MSSVQQVVAWMLNNKAQVLRFMRVLQLVSGLFLLGLGYFIGHEHFHLIRAGVRTQGVILGYKEQVFQSYNQGRSYSSTAFMPIVEFHAGERIIRFKDWKGTQSASGRGTPVTVLYDPADPVSAMIDRPVMNWIPWAPIFAVGLFLVLIAANGFLRSRSEAAPSR
jgi:hypothetical protein